LLPPNSLGCDGKPLCTDGPVFQVTPGLFVCLETSTQCLFNLSQNNLFDSSLLADGPPLRGNKPSTPWRIISDVVGSMRETTFRLSGPDQYGLSNKEIDERIKVRTFFSLSLSLSLSISISISISFSLFLC
jgi:hypothetical protein